MAQITVTVVYPVYGSEEQLQLFEERVRSEEGRLSRPEEDPIMEAIQAMGLYPQRTITLSRIEAERQPKA